MKLQFAFGNPRRKKARKKVGKVKKKVAKRSKKTKNKVIVKTRRKKVAKMAKRRKIKSRRNPSKFLVTNKETKRVAYRSRQTPTEKEAGLIHHRILDLEEIEKMTPDIVEKAKVKKRRLALVKKANDILSNATAEMKTLKAYQSEPNKYDIKSYTKEMPEGKFLAELERMKPKKRKGKIVAKKKAKKKARKKAKSTKKTVVYVPKKAAKKARKKVTRKTRKKVSRKKVALKSRKKATLKARKYVAKKRRGKRRSKIVAHSHSANTRHLKKGARLRVKAFSGKGKKRVSLSGSLKVNPKRSNPMRDVSKLTKTYAGMDVAELGSIALGGALVPVINAGLSKVPGLDVVVAKINEYMGPQAAGSALPILAGVALNAVSEHLVNDRKAKDMLTMAGEGLVAAGVIGLAMGLSQQYITPALGLSGVNYTPMSGVNYTPMSGINYTPMSGMPQLSGPDFGSVDYGGNGGYEEDHKFSRADFGGFSMDADADADYGDDDITGDSLG